MAEEMLHACMTNIIVLLEGALVAENESDMCMFSVLKGVGINIDVHSLEMLYVLWDKVTTELRAREGRALQVLSE